MKDLEEKTNEFCRAEAEIKDQMQELQRNKRMNEEEFMAFLIEGKHYSLLEIRRGALTRVTGIKY